MNNRFYDYDPDFVRNQIKNSMDKLAINEDNVLHQIQDSMSESNKESKNQNKFSNTVQILTLLVSVLTLLSTIWFGVCK